MIPMGLERIVSSRRPALLAQVETIAARLGGTSRSELYRDSTQWVSQLQSACRVLGYRTFLLGSAAVLAAEALGATVDWQREEILSPPPQGPIEASPTTRWSAYLASLAHLTADRRHEAVVAVLPGPQRLAALFGISVGGFPVRVKAALVVLVEQICQRRPDLLLLDEEDASGTDDPTYGRLFATLRNVARHFDVGIGVTAATCDAQRINALAQLRPDALLLGASRDGRLPGVDRAAQCSGSVELIGVGIDLLDAATVRERIGQAGRELAQGRWCLYAARELTADVELAPIRELVNELGIA
jgi:hypothetical protein